MATQSIGSLAQTGLSTGASTGLFGGITSAIGSSLIGLGQKYFGDKGTLANSTAITASFASGESDPLKFFIQGDAPNSDGDMTDDGYLDLVNLRTEGDYMEVNQANGEFGKYGKSMSPSQNKGFDTTDYYRALGLDSIHLDEIESIPVLATP